MLYRNSDIEMCYILRIKCDEALKQRENYYRISIIRLQKDLIQKQGISHEPQTKYMFSVFKEGDKCKTNVLLPNNHEEK